MMSKKNLWRMLGLLLLAIVISSSVFMLDSFRDDDFCRYDAPFYSTISQNIVRTGDWVNLQHSIDTPFEGDHPPLVFWATALSFKFFGESVFTAALFGLLCAIGTCIVVFLIGTILKNDVVGFFGAMGLLLTRYVVRVSRYNTIEIPLMFFIALAVLFLILALNRNKFFSCNYLGKLCAENGETGPCSNGREYKEEESPRPDVEPAALYEGSYINDAEHSAQRPLVKE